VLDYWGFPHIIDAILSYADRRTLIAARSTCRALRDKADALLVYHLASDPTGELVHGIDGGRLPAFYPGLVVAKNGRARGTLTARQHRLLAHVRVLDMPHRSSVLLPPLGTAISSVQTLRMAFAGGTGDEVACPRIVLFRSPTRPELSFPFAPVSCVRKRVCNVRKVVCNFTYCRGSTSATGGAINVVLPDSTSELVIVYTPSSEPPPRNARDVTLSTVEEIAYHASRGIEARYTLVDFPLLEELRTHDGSRLATPPAAQEYFLRLLREHIAARERQKGVQVERSTTVQAVKAHVRFLTREEYASSLTPDEFHFETTMPPTMGEDVRCSL